MLAQAIEQWTELDLPTRRSEWDDSYGHIVANKENGIASRQQLVATVKDFAAAYKADPSPERVEGLLRFMKKFINDLYDRVQVAEDGFVGLYQKIALIDDPVPALQEAQSQVLEATRRAMDAQHALNEHLEQAQEAEAARLDLESRLHEPESTQREMDAASAAIVDQQRRHIASLEQEVELFRTESTHLRRQLNAAQSRLADEAAVARQTTADQDDAPTSTTDGRKTLSTEEIDALVATAAQRLTEERCTRLKENLARAEAEVAELLKTQEVMADQAKQSAERLQQAEAALKALEQKRKADSEMHAAAIAANHSAAAPTPALPVAAAPAVNETGHAKRIAELETALLRAREELRETKQKLDDATVLRSADAVVYASSKLSIDFDDIGGAGGGGNSGATVINMEPVSSSNSNYLSAQDFDELISGGQSNATKVSSTGGAAQGTDMTTTILMRQRDAMRKKLMDAETVIRQLKQQAAVIKFPSVPAAYGRCDQCQAELRRGGGGPSTGALPTDSKRRAAITALDRVGSILGQMLQTSWAARVGVAAYLLSLHFVVFIVVFSWSSASHAHLAKSHTMPRVNLKVQA